MSPAIKYAWLTLIQTSMLVQHVDIMSLFEKSNTEINYLKVLLQVIISEYFLVNFAALDSRIKGASYQLIHLSACVALYNVIQKPIAR